MEVCEYLEFNVVNIIFFMIEVYQKYVIIQQKEYYLHAKKS